MMREKYFYRQGTIKSHLLHLIKVIFISTMKIMYNK